MTAGTLPSAGWLVLAYDHVVAADGALVLRAAGDRRGARPRRAAFAASLTVQVSVCVSAVPFWIAGSRTNVVGSTTLAVTVCVAPGVSARSASFSVRWLARVRDRRAVERPRDVELVVDRVLGVDPQRVGVADLAGRRRRGVDELHARRRSAAS